MSGPRPNARAIEKPSKVNAAPFHIGDSPQRSSRSARIAGTDENGLQAPFRKALELLESDVSRSIDQACYVQLPVTGTDIGNAHRAEFEQVFEPVNLSVNCAGETPPMRIRFMIIGCLGAMRSMSQLPFDAAARPCQTGCRRRRTACFSSDSLKRLLVPGTPSRIKLAAAFSLHQMLRPPSELFRSARDLAD